MDKWKSNGETLLKTFFYDGESSKNEESRRKKWRFSALGDGNGRKYKRKINYFHLQFVRYRTNCAILHNMGRIGKRIWSPMYNNHIWDIVLVNTILKNSWSFISRMVKIPSLILVIPHIHRTEPYIHFTFVISFSSNIQLCKTGQV